MALPLHPLRNKMWQKPNSELLPQLTGDVEDDQALEMSIARHGIQLPVIVSAGMLVDGLRRVKAAHKFNPEAQIPVHECQTDAAGLTIINSLAQVKSLTKFQRLFIIYPIVREAVEKLISLGENTKKTNLDPRYCSDCNIENGAPERAEECVWIEGVSFIRISDLAQFLNVSRRWLEYCRGVYEAIDQKIAQNGNADLVRFYAHKFVFEEAVPVERIASAIGGFDSLRDPDKEAANQTFKQVSNKVSHAFNTVLERINKDVYLAAEHRHDVEQQVENFALKLPDQIAEILSKTLSKRLKA